MIVFLSTAQNIVPTIIQYSPQMLYNLTLVFLYKNKTDLNLNDAVIN